MATERLNQERLVCRPVSRFLRVKSELQLRLTGEVELQIRSDSY